MQKTKIPWADYTINPVKGLCPVACKDLEGKEYCYARKMYKRFKWNPELRFSSKAIDQLAEIKKPSRIFIGSTMELFGDHIKYWWLKTIFDFCLSRPEHTFIFLTKQPQNLVRWSPFPPNCWIGISVDTTRRFADSMIKWQGVKAAKRFISFEPLLEWGWNAIYKEPLTQILNGDKENKIDWLILGSRTQPVRHPPRKWVEEIIQAADEAEVPVFVKEPMASHFGIDKKEFPKVV